MVLQFFACRTISVDIGDASYGHGRGRCPKAPEMGQQKVDKEAPPQAWASGRLGRARKFMVIFS